MIYYSVSTFINAIASTLVLIVVFMENPRSQVNRAFSYFAFSVAFWSYFYFLWQISKNADEALFWCKMLMAGAIFIPSTFLHFSVSLVGQFKRYFKIVIFWYFISTFFLALDFTPFFVKDIKPQLCFQFWPTAGIAYAPFLIMFAVLTLYAHIILYKSFKDFSESKRNQIKYVFLGTAIGFIGGATNYPLWYGIPIPPLGNALVAVYVVLVACAIVKYRLMDIEVVIAKSFILACVYVPAALVPLAIKLWGKNFLYPILGPHWQAVPIIAFVVLFILAPFSFLYYQQRYDQVRMKRLRAQLSKLKEIISSSIDIDYEQLLKNIPAFLVQMYREHFNTDVEYAALYFYNEKTDNYKLFSLKTRKSNKGLPAIISKKDPIPEWLSSYLESFKSEDLEYYQSKQTDKDLINAISNVRNSLKALKAEVCVSCIYKERLLAFLLMGKKQKGSYAQEELDTFSLLAHDVASAVRSGELREDLEQSYIDAIHAIITALEERDPYTKGHSERVVKYSTLIAEELKDTFPFTRILNLTDKVKRAALLHDVGKIGVPDSILLKPGKLTDEEYTKLKQHPTTSLHIIQSIKNLSEDIREGIESHHERYDGKGYGKGSQGHRVPPIARIIAVADTFDAMTSDRPYRKALPEKSAVEEINKVIMTQFDPRVVDAFNKAYTKGNFRK